MPKATTAANAVLNHHVRGTTPAAITPFMGLLTNVGTPTEPAGNAYARVAMTTTNFSSAAASGSIANTVEISFPTPTGSWGEIIGMAVYDASTAGNVVRSAYLVSGNYFAFTADSTADTLLIPANPFANDQRAILIDMDGSVLPTGLSENTLYYVVATTGNTIQLAVTQGGAAINFTAVGAGTIARVIPQTIGLNNTPKFAIGAAVFTEV